MSASTPAHRLAPILYLHGFASSPGSAKATAFAQRWRQRGHTVVVPDLNGSRGFAHLRLGDIVRTAHDAAVELARQCGEPPIIVGSSLGGYTALRLVSTENTLARCAIVMAPAIGFIPRLIQRIGPQLMDQWQREGTFPFDHYGLRQTVAVDYALIEDGLRQPDPAQLEPTLPVLAIHGQHDDSVPVSVSIDYARRWPDRVTLAVVNSDHGLLDQIDWMDARIVQFLAALST